MTIYFVAGEASADNHGAALMCALRDMDSNLRFIGRGGPRMKAIAGEQFENWIDKSGVLGLWEVLKQYGYFRQQFRVTLREIERTKADAVVLIDYPGFNLRLARALRKHSAAAKIIYYISPQVWAWNRGRIRKMAGWIDLMLCIFPFEAALYNQSGLRTIFVGHPMIERLRAAKTEIERDPNLIGLFPGSRAREVRKILPILIATAKELVRQKPNLRFEIAAASRELAEEMETILRPHLSPLPLSPWERRTRSASEGKGVGQGEEDIGRGRLGNQGRRPYAKRLVREERHVQDRWQFPIKVGEASAIMQRAFAGFVASGSATLEAAYFRLPFVLIYKVSWITYLAGRLVVKVKYLGMPNVLANKLVVPEFIQHKAQPKILAEAVLRLIDDASARQRMISDFDTIINSLGGSGASKRAARAIVEELR